MYGNLTNKIALNNKLTNVRRELYENLTNEIALNNKLTNKRRELNENLRQVGGRSLLHPTYYTHDYA